MLLESYRQHLRAWLSAALVAGFAGLTPAQADIVTIRLDQAQIMQLPDRVATIVIGNPLIADATLQGGGILVVTGKGYGATNLVALDRAGRVLLSHTVQVLGAGTDDMVVVYKGVERETYSCASNCERRITLGDSTTYFNANMSESGSRSGQAQSAAPK
jgi:Flp pilus assembly secretin CpaC